MESLSIQKVQHVSRIKAINGFLLICGFLSSLVYMTANITGAMQWEEYNSASQTVSELSAIGAPSRPLAIGLFTAYSLLTIAFGMGVWRSAIKHTHLRIVGKLLVIYGVICLTGPLTPMHQRQVLAADGGTLTDNLHILSTMIDVLFILLILGFGSAAFGKGFRFYTYGTILLLLVFGMLTVFDTANMEADLPTPWMGIKERINIGLFLVWVMVLAALLFKIQPSEARSGGFAD